MFKTVDCNGISRRCPHILIGSSLIYPWIVILCVIPVCHYLQGEEENAEHWYSSGVPIADFYPFFSCVIHTHTTFYTLRHNNRAFQHFVFAVSCLGELCSSIADCKGSSPEVECFGGICQCAEDYSGTDEGQCIKCKLWLSFEIQIVNGTGYFPE